MSPLLCLHMPMFPMCSTATQHLSKGYSAPPLPATAHATCYTATPDQVGIKGKHHTENLITTALYSSG